MASLREHRQHDLEKCEKVLCFVANERFGMTHDPVGCFGEISLKLEPFREFKGCGTSHDSQVLGIIQCFHFPGQSSRINSSLGPWVHKSLIFQINGYPWGWFSKNTKTREPKSVRRGLHSALRAMSKTQVPLTR